MVRGVGEGQEPLFDGGPPVTHVPLFAASDRATIQEKFEVFHALNPWVFEALVRLTGRAHRAGRQRIGMKMLFEVLRWNVWMETNDPSYEFKLSNSYTSRYARLMVVEHPEFEEMFELRELRERVLV